MTQPQFVDYSGALPILLPVSIRHHWQGFYLPLEPDSELEDDPWAADLELPDGSRFSICDDFDFANPKTDYDRACALSGKPAVEPIAVGPGQGLVFRTELDCHAWWPEKRMYVNGGPLPELSKLERVQWSDELLWQTEDSDFVLMNSCYHGAGPDSDGSFDVHLAPGEYQVRFGRYGWERGDPSLLLFHFVLQGGG